jgi:hypothetical protein
MHIVNRILALRICELDSAVQSPTMKLLEGYTSANIDSKCKDIFIIIIVLLFWH